MDSGTNNTAILRRSWKGRKIQVVRSRAESERIMGKKIICPNCRGSGKVNVTEKCGACNGAGEIPAIDDWGKKVKVKCYICKGTGKTTDTDACNMCGGDGEIEV